MSKRIHIVIVEPSAIIRCGIITLVQQDSTLNAEIMEVKDISTLSQGGIYSTPPDLLIVNPSHVGLQTPAQLKGEIGNMNLKIIALQSSFMEQSLLQNYDVVLSIYDGFETIIEKITSAVKQEESIPERKELSAREKEIVVCVVKGMTNKQIAETLCLSTHTVIAHRRNLANKLQIHSPSGLTIYAIVNKLVDITEIKNTISQNREEV